MFTPVVQYIYNFCIYYVVCICMDTKGWMELVTQVGVCNYFWGISIKSWMELDTKVQYSAYVSYLWVFPAACACASWLAWLFQLHLCSCQQHIPHFWPFQHPTPHQISNHSLFEEARLVYLLKEDCLSKLFSSIEPLRAIKRSVNLFRFVIRFRGVLKSSKAESLEK